MTPATNHRPDRFRPDWLPDWQQYATLQGLTFRDRDSGKTQRRMVCTIHGGERDSLVVNVTTGAWMCQSCGARGGDVLAHYRALHGATFREAAEALGAWDDDAARRPPQLAAAPRPPAAAVPATGDAWKLERSSAIWRASMPITSEAPPAGYLLDARRVPLPPVDGDLRWLPDLRLFGFNGPALVGRMSLAEDHREARGLHLTWLQVEAAGTWRRTERRYLGAKKGCVVRLWPDEAVTTGLGIAEGIESALALAHAYPPVWAAMDAGNLAAFPALAGIECLTIAADHDPAGIAAAEACGQRWASADVDVEIIMPPTPRQDVADVARCAA